jgi:2,4-dienoyl-CoA reductase-like NADH-dependent reductase (Old Yellow Enzyme family)
VFKGAYILNEGLTKESAQSAVDRGEADAAAFGRAFIANPDLVERFRRDAPLNSVNAETIYTDDATGYNDYPLLDDATMSI